MNEFFLKIVNMSISASWLVLAVLILRLVLKKAPKWMNVLLWGIVAVRLMLPFSLESVFSLIPSGETVPMEIMLSPAPTIHTGIESVNTVVNPILSESLAPAAGASMNPLQFWIPMLSLIWATGAAVMLILVVVSYLRLRRKVVTAVLLRENIYQSEAVLSPFVLGIVKPKIYLPFVIDAQHMEPVIAHEQAHILRRDHWWKPLGFLLLTVHWFNPLLWLAYALLCRDIEFACDEKVIGALDEAQRADYSEALLSCCVSRRAVTACPVAFGETGVKGRIKSVLSYKKPALWLIIAALVLCGGLCLCFLTDPVNSPMEDPLPQESIPEQGSIPESENISLTFKGQSPENEKILLYHVDLGQKGAGGRIYIERWMNGSCLRSDPLPLSSNDHEIQIRIENEEKKGEYLIYGEIQLSTDTQTDSIMTTYPHADVNHVFGSSLSTHEKDKTIPIRPTDEKIIAAIEFDLGSGIPSIGCEALENDPEHLKNTDYMIIVRACFDPAYAQSAATEDMEDAGQPSQPGSAPMLTLEDVIRLSQKGNDLTPEEFSSYAHDRYSKKRLDSPYGIYPIDDLFYVDISEDSEGGIHMVLYSSDAQNEGIHIQLGSDEVTDFIDRHKNNPPVFELSGSRRFCPIGYHEDLFDKMVELGSASTPLVMESPQSLPVVRINSRKEWTEFRDAVAPYVDAEREYPDTYTFNRIRNFYTEDFFEHSTIFVMYIPSNDPSFQLELWQLQISEGILSIGTGVMAQVDSSTAPEGWFMIIEVPTEELTSAGGYTELDAQIVSTHYPYIGTENADPIRTYVFTDSEDAAKPCLTLYDNGWFLFTFSLFTHYQGTGPYEIVNDRLILRTYDGQFVYEFDIVEDYLQFDAESSSEELWSSALYDGAILE